MVNENDKSITDMVLQALEGEFDWYSGLCDQLMSRFPCAKSDFLRCVELMAATMGSWKLRSPCNAFPIYNAWRAGTPEQQFHAVRAAKGAPMTQEVACYIELRKELRAHMIEVLKNRRI